MFKILVSSFQYAAASLLFAWVVSAHVSYVSTPYGIAGSTNLVLQAYSNVNLDDVAVLSESCPSGRDSSLNLFALVFISGAVSKFQVDIVYNVIDLSVVDIY